MEVSRQYFQNIFTLELRSDSNISPILILIYFNSFYFVNIFLFLSYQAVADMEVSLLRVGNIFKLKRSDSHFFSAFYFSQAMAAAAVEVMVS